MLDLPASGIEYVSLALTGGPLTTGPPGKPLRPLEYRDQLKVASSSFSLALVGLSTWGFIKAVKPCPEFLFLPQASVFLVACSASDLHLHAIDQIRSVAQSCPTLCDPMNRSTPGFPVHHQLPEFTETLVHRVSDAIQSSHPLSYCCASL